MADFQFELLRYTRKKVRGYSGTVGPFGEVTIESEWRKGSIKTAHRQQEVRLLGEQMPEVVYRTVGPGRPMLRNARLLIEGELARLTFNSKAFRNKARALRIDCGERSYEYVVTRLAKGATLSRPGIEISFTRGKNAQGKWGCQGTVSGEADALDLALAIVFEDVDTMELTTTGHATEAIHRFLNPRSNEPIA
ncbi:MULTISPECIES: hypothetical protein [Streptomyces]|uniref:hypothetical protein n=1 Tax=Streptomyces TaxID=1883 RepID=UPI000F656F91|nr:hypothetical protein [Streptomyces alboflavus]